MAKPIVLLGYPDDQPREQMEVLTRNLKRYLTEYYVLVYQRRDTEMTFDVFNHENNGTKTEKEIIEYIKKEMNE